MTAKPAHQPPLKEGDYSWPKWDICKVKVSREGEWWRLEAYDIKWGCYDPWDRVGFTIVPDDPKLYNNVTFYVDDVQLYSLRSNACLLLMEARIPNCVLRDNKTYYCCVNSATVKNLRSSEVGTSNAGINDAVFRKERRGSSVNEVYVPISVQKGDMLEVTFSLAYYATRSTCTRTMRSSSIGP
jgi:hypothetical protein